MVETYSNSKERYNHRMASMANLKQHGVVLVVSLVFLVALTAVASALMLNTTTDIKMSGASEDKVVAIQEAFGAIDEIIFVQVRPTGDNVNTFAKPISTFRKEGVDTPEPVSLALLTQSNMRGDITKANIGLSENEYALDSDCPHSKLASSTGVFTCNVLKVELTKVYGRKNTSTIDVNSGITQQLLK